MNEFAGRFAAWWERPDPDRLGELLAPDVRLVQPLSPDTRGLEEAKGAFRRLIRMIPDIHAEVRDSAADGGLVFVYFTLIGTYGGEPIEWDAVDRFIVGPDGLATERVSFFDSQPLALQMAARPRGWPQLARARFRPRLRARPAARVGAPAARRSS